jgi:hypothetical protein
MIFSEEIANFIRNVLIEILMIFVLIDMALIIVIKIRRPLIKNKYYAFHKKHGFLKVIIVKMIAAVIIIYAIKTHQPSSGALAAPILLYVVYVTKLLFDLIRNRQYGGHLL